MLKPQRTLAQVVTLSAALLSGAAGASAQVRVSAASADDAAQAERGSYVVGENETLWSLSERFLGSGEEWPRLWSYNPEITNPHYIYPGHVVRLREGVPGGPPADAPRSGLQSHVLGGPRSKLQMTPALEPGATLLGEQAYLDKDALKSVSRIVGSAEDHMMMYPSDEIYVRLDASGGRAPEPGKELTIFARYTRKEVSPKASGYRTEPAGTAGEIVRILGHVKVLRYDSKKHIATCLITNARDPIERGHEVADIGSALTIVPPRANAKRVEAHIVAATRALGTLAQHQLVFIDAGSAQGVQSGNTFQVVRQGDNWRKQLSLRESLSGAERPDPRPASASALPSEDVAELRILEVRSGTATALIIKSGIEVYPGDRVEMREGS